MRHELRHTQLQEEDPHPEERCEMLEERLRGLRRGAGLDVFIGISSAGRAQFMYQPKEAMLANVMVRAGALEDTWRETVTEDIVEAVRDLCDELDRLTATFDGVEVNDDGFEKAFVSIGQRVFYDMNERWRTGSTDFVRTIRRWREYLRLLREGYPVNGSSHERHEYMLLFKKNTSKAKLFTAMRPRGTEFPLDERAFVRAKLFLQVLHSIGSTLNWGHEDSSYMYRKMQDVLLLLPQSLYPRVVWYIQHVVRGDMGRMRVFEHAKLVEKDWTLTGILQYILEEKPRKLGEFLEMVAFAKAMGLEMSEAEQKVLTPLGHRSYTDVRALVQTEEGGLSELEKRYAAVLYQNEKHAHAGKVVRDGEEGLRKKVARLRNLLDTLPPERYADARVDAVVGEIDSLFARELFPVVYRTLRARALMEGRGMFHYPEMTRAEFFDPHVVRAYQHVRSMMKDGGGYENHGYTGMDLIEHYLKDKETRGRAYVEQLPKNREWLEEMFGSEEKRENWVRPKTVMYEAHTFRLASSVDRDIAHHAQQIEGKMKRIDMNLTETDYEAVGIVRTLEETVAEIKYEHIPDRVDELLEKVRQRPDVDGEAVEDIRVQTRAIRRLLTRRGEVEQSIKALGSVVVREAENPLEAMMMGEWVHGSCLALGSVNFWSAVTNAVDINKKVFYITREDGSVLGRFLLALDTNKKIVTFRVYTNCDIDFTPIADAYITALARSCGVGVNGSTKRVVELHGLEWYKDPMRNVGGTDEYREHEDD